MDLRALQESGAAMRSKIDSSLSVLENLITAYSVSQKVDQNMPSTSFGQPSNSQSPPRPEPHLASPRPEPHIASNRPPKLEDLEPIISTYPPAPVSREQANRVQDSILPDRRREEIVQRIDDIPHDGSDLLPQIADLGFDFFLDDASLYVPQAQAS